MTTHNPELPLSIEEREFSTSRKGYDKREVRALKLPKGVAVKPLGHFERPGVQVSVRIEGEDWFERLSSLRDAIRR